MFKKAYDTTSLQRSDESHDAFSLVQNSCQRADSEPESSEKLRGYDGYELEWKHVADTWKHHPLTGLQLPNVMHLPDLLCI